MQSLAAVPYVLPVRAQSAHYEVLLGRGLLASVGEHLDQLTSGGLRSGKQRAIVVTSPEVFAPWGEPLLSRAAKPTSGFPPWNNSSTRWLKPGPIAIAC